MDPKWGPEPVNTQMEKVLLCLTAPSVQEPGCSITHMCFHRPLAFSSYPSFGCLSHRFWQGTHWRGLDKFPSSHSPWLIINSSGESCWWSRWKQLFGKSSFHLTVELILLGISKIMCFLAEVTRAKVKHPAKKWCQVPLLGLISWVILV